MTHAGRSGLWLARWLWVAAALLASGCAQDVAAPDSRVPQAIADAAPVAPVEGREPARDVVVPPSDTSVKQELAPVDATCAVDADCEVKDVGNCCGYMPACVNRSAQPDPAAVQRECQRTGASGVCGFQELSGCRCEAKRCVGVASGAPGGGDVR